MFLQGDLVTYPCEILLSCECTYLKKCKLEVDLSTYSHFLHIGPFDKISAVISLLLLDGTVWNSSWYQNTVGYRDPVGSGLSWDSTSTGKK